MVYERHAAYYLAFAQGAGRWWSGPRESARAWEARFEQELDNLRAALRWHVDHGRAEQALHLAGALEPFLSGHVHLSEGRAWVAALLARPDVPALARSRRMGRERRLGHRHVHGAAGCRPGSAVGAGAARGAPSSQLFSHV